MACCKDKSIYLPEVSTLVRKESMTNRDMYFEFKMSGKDLGHKPGQFAEISIPGIGEAPFSISSSPTRKGTFEMVIRKIGGVSNALHEMKSGDTVGIRGPYGTAFPMDEAKGKDLLFVTGGIGLVPARSAIHYALDNRKAYGKISILFGCTDPSQRLFCEELESWKSKGDLVFEETVDRSDGKWKGNVGVITTLFPKLKGKIDPKTTRAIVVGPPVMYKFVIMELDKLGFAPADIILSLERRMKCGVGKCGHCQIDNRYVCQDGPVFSYESLKGLVEAL